jgi:putative nucleotidyltransferase with HDIG domain
MIKTFPSTIAIGLLGIFLAFAHNEYGKEIVLLFFVPLLLARYSFKLYFDSQRMALDTIHALNEALHAKDAYTGGHTGRVEVYAIELAKAYGLPTSDCEIIKTAALLHDIGKIGVPDEILNKPGKLTEEEYLKIQDHSTIGAKILGNVDSLKKLLK